MLRKETLMASDMRESEPMLEIERTEDAGGRATVSVRVLYLGALQERLGGVRQEGLRVAEGTSVAALLSRLEADHQEMARLRPVIQVAVNSNLVSPDWVLGDGDEVALLPPVAGGSTAACAISDAALDTNSVIASVVGPGQGGVVVFIGCVREVNRDQKVLRLQYDAYVPMALQNLEDIVRRCEGIADGVRVAVSHRTGVLEVGEVAVVVAAAAPHRGQAFEAARMCIELLKQETPIWKKEFTEDGHAWLGMRP
jgi:molybdopterin synthase catalytic subunit/molybdopterin converting factor small subunit